MTDPEPADADHDCEDEGEYFEERAGILEFDAGYSREEAERLARVETLARYFGGDVAASVRKASAQGVRVRLVDGGLRAGGPVEVRDRQAPKGACSSSSLDCLRQREFYCLLECQCTAFLPRPIKGCVICQGRAGRSHAPLVAGPVRWW